MTIGEMKILMSMPPTHLDDKPMHYVDFSGWDDGIRWHECEAGVCVGERVVKTKTTRL